MIYLNRKMYWLHNITEIDFWKRLNEITVGQNISPEMGFSTPFVGKSENVFGGRKVKNKFSIFLYRPITRELWIRILAKGKVLFDDKKNCLLVDCRFEIPIWSIFILLLFCLFFVIPSYLISLKTGIIISSIFILLSCLLIFLNYRKTVNSLKKQFDEISNVEIS
jgi:hypothetical protein